MIQFVGVIMVEYSKDLRHVVQEHVEHFFLAGSPCPLSYLLQEFLEDIRWQRLLNMRYDRVSV